MPVVTDIDSSFVRSLLKKRLPSSHKGDHGHALLVAGQKGKMGAAVIAATACLRCGAGLLTVNVPSEERFILQVSIPEAMLLMREESHDFSSFAAVAIGPGTGTGEAAGKLLENVFHQSQSPLVLDADALTMVSKDKTKWALVRPGTILTPHPGEFDRLFGKYESNEERRSKALEISLSYPWVIVLKGQNTSIFFKGETYINHTGNAGLAKGGSGDALTGMILSFLAQGYQPLHAAITAVYLHGLAADLALEQQSVESLLVTDIFAFTGRAFRATAADE